MGLIMTGGLESLPIQLGKYAKSLYRFHRNVRYAGADIDMLREEVETCRSLALIFIETTKDIQGQAKEKVRQSGVDQIIVGQSTKAYSRIKRLLKRLKPLQKSANSNLMEKLLAMIRWNIYRQDVQVPIVILGGVKSSLQLLGTILLLDNNVSKIRSDSTLNQTERKSLLSTIKLLRRDIRHHERTLEKIQQTMKQQYDQTENYHQSSLDKLSQIIDIIQEVKREPISEARKLHGASSLSSPVSASSQNRGESSSHIQRRQQRNSATTIQSNVSNHRPNSRNTRYDERPVGDFRRSVHAQPSISSRPDSETSSSVSNSRALILRSRHKDQEHNSNSGDTNINEEFEIQPNALVLRTGARSQNRRTSTSQARCEEIGQNYPVYHEYEDNSREMYYLSRAPSYARGSDSGSDSAAPSENQFSSRTYIPIPPFAKFDVNELRRKQAERRKGQDEHE